MLATFVANNFSDPEQTPLPPDQGCLVTVEDMSTTLTWEQSMNAAIIVGESIRRELPPRAATIALTTAYQESDLRNLDYGDADSLGLFQQRPSQGWGSEDQIMDPWYSAGKFYEALIKVDGWETSVINDVAQEVQRSDHPEKYSKHEGKARAWASALTGYSPAAISCIDRAGNAGHPSALISFLQKVWPQEVSVTSDELSGLNITGADEVTSWAIGQLLLVQAQSSGLVTINVLDQSLTVTGNEYSSWAPAQTPLSGVTAALRR